MATTPKKRAGTARAELQAWFVDDLRPKLLRAVSTGRAEQRAVEALDSQLRALLDLSQGREDAA